MNSMNTQELGARWGGRWCSRLRSLHLSSSLVALLACCAVAARAQSPSLGPLVNISSPDPFAACGPQPFISAYATIEPMIAVNPLNANNLVAVWIGGGMDGVASSTTLDGGKTWFNQPLPGTSCISPTGDPWVSFGPNGDLYASGSGAPLN